MLHEKISEAQKSLKDDVKKVTKVLDELIKMKTAGVSLK